MDIPAAAGTLDLWKLRMDRYRTRGGYTDSPDQDDRSRCNLEECRVYCIHRQQLVPLFEIVGYIHSQNGEI